VPFSGKHSQKIIGLVANHIPVNKILRVLHKKSQQKKCPILNQVVQLYVQMVLLPDLIGLVVFSVKRKVIKRPGKFLW
jgi:hypothetical protein